MRRPGHSAVLSRRSLVAGLAAAPVAACGRTEAPTKPLPASRPAAFSLSDAVAGAWRPAQERTRDPWRHPAETLHFLGLKPGMTVIEMWPGAGWYSAILAPYLARTGGRLIAAGFDMSSPQPAEVTRLMSAYRERLTRQPELFGKVEFVGFGPKSGPLAPAGSVDLVLTFRNLHNWMAAGYVDKAFHDMAQALKTGGVLGLEEHRAEAGTVQDPVAPNGYVTEAYVKAVAGEAGLAFAAASEINANPRDGRNHPFGVWTLPPTRQSAAVGKGPNPFFDHAKYDAIGESDRMTLRFVRR